MTLCLAAAGCQDIGCGVDVEHRLTLAAGPSESAAGCVARAFTSSLNEQALEYRASVLRTSGAAESLVALREGRSELAITTADVLAQAVNGEGPFAGQTVSARAVAALYPSQLQLVVPASSPVTGLSQLRDRTVGVGPQGSGMEFTVARTLGAALLERRVTTRSMPWPELLSSLEEGTLDGVFWLDAVPSPAILEAARRRPLRILNTASVVPLLQHRYGEALYRIAEIPASTYGNPAPAGTAAVATVLVARHDTAEETVFAATSALFRHAPALARACPAMAGLTTSLGARPQPAALHPGAALFYRQFAPPGR